MSMFSDPPPQFGLVFAGIYVHTRNQANLLQQCLQQMMVTKSGKDGEKLLAQWNNELESIKTKALKEKWRGWELPMKGQQHDK